MTVRIVDGEIGIGWDLRRNIRATPQIQVYKCIECKNQAYSRREKFDLSTQVNSISSQCIAQIDISCSSSVHPFKPRNVSNDFQFAFELDPEQCHLKCCVS